MISSYSKSFFSCAEQLTEKLNRLYTDENRQFDLLPHLEHCAVQGVCSTLFGMNLMDKRIDDIYENTMQIFEA